MILQNGVRTEIRTIILFLPQVPQNGTAIVETQRNENLRGVNEKVFKQSEESDPEQVIGPKGEKQEEENAQQPIGDWSAQCAADMDRGR